jgi:hypothetical protein
MKPMDLGAHEVLAISLGVPMRGLDVTERRVGPTGEHAALGKETVGSGRMQHVPNGVQAALALLQKRQTLPRVAKPAQRPAPPLLRESQPLGETVLLGDVEGLRRGTLSRGRIAEGRVNLGEHDQRPGNYMRIVAGTCPREPFSSDPQPHLRIAQEAPYIAAIEILQMIRGFSP